MDEECVKYQGRGDEGRGIREEGRWMREEFGSTPTHPYSLSPIPSTPTLPSTWEPEERFELRCELDAAFFRLYGVSRDDVEYIMDTFPIVRDNDIKAYGVYRTKQRILELWDAFGV